LHGTLFKTYVELLPQNDSTPEILICGCVNDTDDVFDEQVFPFALTITDTGLRVEPQMGVI
jgi:hypothetical protein